MNALWDASRVGTNGRKTAKPPGKIPLMKIISVYHVYMAGLEATITESHSTVPCTVADLIISTTNREQLS
jgi:hypothetical protein